MMCDRQVDCYNLSPMLYLLLYSVNWIAIFSQKLCYGIYSCYIGQLHYLLRYETHKYDEIYN